MTRPPLVIFQCGGLRSLGSLMLSPRRIATRSMRGSAPSSSMSRSWQTCSNTTPLNERIRLSGMPVVPPVAAGAENQRLLVMKFFWPPRRVSFSSIGQLPSKAPPLTLVP